MKRNLFNQYIQTGNFRELFISEMGWNNPSGATMLPVYTIDERIFQIVQIAERSGFQILQCEINEIPSSSLCKKLDTKLRKNAENYICIFKAQNTTHHLWMAPVRKVEKRDVVLVEYDSPDKAGFLFEKMEGLSFGFENTLIRDVVEKVQAAFLINSEKITKDFYTGFKREHTNFAKFITGIDDHIADKDNKNKQWYTSVMLNRLMFCYFIQKKGFLDGDVDYLRHKLEWTQQNEGEDRFFNKFYKGFLVNLFHDGLNDPLHDSAFEAIYGRIPYLNGGMFDVHQIERDYARLDIADEAFQSLFDFFDKWHWHLDDRMTATGKDINPDVLGYIFEQYINDRAQMGAYYTKEDITEYIGRNCILPFLFDAVRTTTTTGNFKNDGYVWETLKNSGDKYIYDAVKKGYTPNWRELIPNYISVGLDTTAPNLLDRRARWNERTSDEFALPTEIWRETVERLQRCETVLNKIANGELHEINDFITYNLNIRQFAYDLLAGTQDHFFVKQFYQALQRITILDPTCGSGAFLFAAMNILEPLYEICIERMEDFHAKNDKLFVNELGEIANKYRSNIQYFIYKSIILRNLYGVDIMVEATEIAKLRLFLKMVAVVEVDYRAANLGLDPLPDIDFNIRCGNTLVGYATEEELNNDLTWGDMFANLEFKHKVETEMEKVAMTYERFKQIQISQAEDMAAFKEAKTSLQNRLVELNKTLNQRLHSATSQLPYEDWMVSHQPFHWLAEFYQIMHDRGGFDVIIGNPPYVEYGKKDKNSGKAIRDIYQLKGYVTLPCNNLYAFCIERSYEILNTQCRFGMIVPNSCISADKMIPVQKVIVEKKDCWISNYAWRPSKLFEGANMLLAIILNTKSLNPSVKTSIYHRWNNEYRPFLFKSISYTDATNVMIKGSIPKIPSDIAIDITTRMQHASKNVLMSSSTFNSPSNNYLYYFRAVLYWFKVLNKVPILIEDGIETATGEMKPLYFATEEQRNIFISILSSNTYFMHYVIWSSCQVVNSRDFDMFLDYNALNENQRLILSQKGDLLQKDYQKNSVVKTRNYAKRGRSFVMQKQYFFIKKSKPIIDEIDKILAAHYGFTEEELDFIINYDIKYRMGDELNEE